MDRVTVTVEARDPRRADEATILAAAVGAALAQGPVADEELRIVLLASTAELWDSASRHHGTPLSFAALDLRTGSGNLSRKQPLAKAIGSQSHTVLDVTGGWAHDAALLACMGWQVTCIERVPVLVAAQRLALKDARHHPALAQQLDGRLQLHQGDSKLLMARLPRHDTIYLDPMFEPRKGSALPKKPAQLLQRIAGQDADAPEVLALARSICHRVVVKRPDNGQPLATDPDLQFKGRLVRYDVYLQHVTSQ